MRVVICGAGLGGLVLAQALRGHADVIVLDRDREAADTGGYRIALTPEAVEVVERHVPASLVGRIRDVSDGPSTFSQFTIANARLRPIVVAPEPEGQDRMLCQRRALRTLLVEELGDRIRFSSTVMAAEALDGGGIVTLHDGTRVEGDVIVAAEGARSPTVRSIAGAETSRDVGLIGIAGSSPLAGRGCLPSFLRRGPALAVDHRGLGMFLSLASRGLGPVPAELADAVGPPSLVWGLIARRDMLGDVARAPAGELVTQSRSLVEAWHPWMRTQIDASDLGRVAAFNFRAASPTAPRFPWVASRITAIGDAVHAMPPTGGRAGSTAIRSAGALADALIAGDDIDEAITRYQVQVDAWAVPAIRESLGPVRALQALARPTAKTLARPALAVAGVIGSTIHRSALMHR